MDDIEIIKNKIDIVDLISEYIDLKPAGVNYKGLCPFHQEKTPSFMVNQERQFFKCFGCGKSGDIFTFVQEIEGLEFAEALKLLADKAGVELRQKTSFQHLSSNQKVRLKEINRVAEYFFHNFLLQIPKSKLALDYLYNRGLDEKTIKNWLIGYTPNQWELLKQYLLKKGFSIDDLLASGLVIKKNTSRYYDRFRDRIMFPIHNVYGECVGFTGRILKETEISGGKYLNTPQTLIFDKSKLLFGLNKAKLSIKEQNKVIIVEGQMDVIACHQIGMKNVVASSGTALTIEQIKLLKRFTDNLIMAFDADEAGLKAAKRGIDLALQQGLKIKIIQIPREYGKDPDECVRNYPDKWLELVDNAQEIMAWHLNRVIKPLENNTEIANIQMAVNDFLEQVINLPYATERDIWLRKLAEHLNLNVDKLYQDLQKIDNKFKNKIKINKNLKEVKINKQINRTEQLITSLSALVFKLNDLSILSKLSKKTKEIILKSSLSALWSIFFDLAETKQQLIIDKIQEKYHNKADLDALILQADLEFTNLDQIQLKKEFRNLELKIIQDWLKQEKERLTLLINKAQKNQDKDREELLLSELNSLIKYNNLIKK